MVQPHPSDTKIALAPLVGREQTDAADWLGALLSKLLGEFLSGAGLVVLPYNRIAQQIKTGKHRLPLQSEAVDTLRRELDLRALIHGQYTLDEEGKMLGVRLLVEAPNVPRVPLEASSPLAGFKRFMARLALALIEAQGLPITDHRRERVQGVKCPANFEAFRHLAQAHAAWAKGQNELALAAISSTLALDPDLEEAIAIEVAIARTAKDTATTQAAFRRWIEIANKQKKPLVAGERLLLLGHWMAERGEWATAARAYQEARDLFQREEHEYGKSQALNNLANLGLLRGKLQPAIQTYRRSLRFFEADSGAQHDTAITLFNLGLAHKTLGQREEAIRATDEARTMARRLKDTHLEAMCVAQRGALYDDAGEWTQANAQYDQALRLLDVVGDDRGRAIVKNHQAILYRQQGAYDQAERLMREALTLFDKDTSPHERAVLWLNLADLYLSQRKFDQAWEYARQAQAAFKRLKSQWLEVANDLIDTLENLPQPQKEEPTPPLSSAPPSPPESSDNLFGPAELPPSLRGMASPPPYDEDDSV